MYILSPWHALVDEVDVNGGEEPGEEFHLPH